MQYSCHFKHDAIIEKWGVISRHTPESFTLRLGPELEGIGAFGMHTR